MKKAVSLVLFFAMVLAVAGCGTQRKISQSSLQSKLPVAAETVATSTEGKSLLDEFMDYVPDAKIFDKKEFDLDDNGENDYIILYSSKTEKTSTGLAVFLSNSNYGAIGLDADNVLIYTSPINIIFEGKKPIISVDLRDPSNNTLYNYKVEYMVDTFNHETNFKISSEEKRLARTRTE